MASPLEADIKASSYWGIDLLHRLKSEYGAVLKV